MHELHKVCTALKLPPKDIKSKLLILVKAQLYNPEFNNQAKDKMVRPSVNLPKEESDGLHSKFMHALKKWDSLSSYITEWRKMQEQMQLRSMEKKKSGTKQCIIEGLDPAILASTPKAHECTLILCEGLSAKTFAVQGIHKVGWRDKKGRMYFGVYPLRGKCLNVRNASSSTISQNREITDIFNALNLKHNTDYSLEQNFQSLSYGKMMILTDADSDGTHIAGLLLNMMECVAPTLLKRDPPFVHWMKTPIAKIWPSRTADPVLTFYSDEMYWKYMEEHDRKEMKKVKYFKGLGACSDEEVRDTFGEKVLGFEYDTNCRHHLVKVFDQKKSTERKQWLCDYMNSTVHINGINPPLSLEDEKNERYAITSFVNDDLIKFSWEDCERNLPHVMDGLKVSQRKILYAIFKKKLHKRDTPVMKVAQLAGYVAEVSNYHHGEQCLVDTICRLTHSFVGGLTIPFLERDGQFGSRSHLGKDAASGRYLFTKGDAILPFLFRSEDEELLEYAKEDGDIVQPEYYAPVIPLLLVNGCSTAIGTGWSCTIPPHHPLQVIEILREYLKSLESVETSMKNGDSTIPSLIPYYRNFKGPLLPMTENSRKYTLSGIAFPFDPHTNNPASSLGNKEKEKKIKKCKSKAKNLPLPPVESLEDSTAVPVVPVLSLPSHPYIPSLKGLRATSRIAVVTEIPVSCSLHRYKEYLDGLVEKKKIRKYENHSTSNEPLFVVFFLTTTEENNNNGNIDNMVSTPEISEKEWELLKLKETVSEENMVVLVHPTTTLSGRTEITENMNVQKTLKQTKVFKMTKSELMETFCTQRLSLYSKRKQKMMDSLVHQIALWKEKIRFLEEIVLRDSSSSSSPSSFWKMEEDEIRTLLHQKKFMVVNEDKAYHYLTDLPIRQCTEKQVEKWKKEKEMWEKELGTLKKKNATDIWREDLTELEQKLGEMYPELRK
jgi:hypothetical protein